MGWIPWRYWNIVELPGKAGRSGMTEMSGKTGMSLEQLE